MDLKVDIGLCRFCSNEGIFSLNDTNENYSDIILECFNIFVSTSQPASSLICSECKTQLRDAYSFRQKVMRAEHNLDKDVTIEVAQAMDTKPVDIKLEPGGPKTEPPDWIIEDYDPDVARRQTDAAQVYTFTRLEVFNVWFKHQGRLTASERTRHVYEDMKNALAVPNKGKNNFLEFYNRVWIICKRLVHKWKQAHRNKNRFLRRNINWLKTMEYIEPVGPHIQSAPIFRGIGLQIISGVATKGQGRAVPWGPQPQAS